MSWKKMRIPSGAQRESLPGDRGRYLLWLEPPIVEGPGHYVHFSWKDDSFCIRDYIHRVERRQDRGLAAIDIWKAATDRVPAKGELYVPVENFEFWTAKLTELSENHGHGRPMRLWSRLSSKFAPKSKEGNLNADQGDQHVDDSRGESDLDVYQRFTTLWRNDADFDVIKGTVGCSARYVSEPLLWVYPKYFQIAPRGKGNAHHSEVKDSRDRHFPELRAKGIVRFDSEHFTWDRFQSFIKDVQNMTRRASR